MLVNPTATTTTSGVSDVIAAALSAEVKLDVEHTKRQGHAGFLAAGAAHEGYELVVALGGDGTVNEVVQGLARSDTKLAVLPGGSTNVWARTLGYPNDAIEATALLLRTLRDGHVRTVNLGRANGRLFGFGAGFGFDAEVVRYVERRSLMKRTVRQATFLVGGARAVVLDFDRRAAHIDIEIGGATVARDLRSVVACNSDPFTFLGQRPARLCPRASLDGDLDLLALRRVDPAALLGLMRRSLFGDGAGHARSVSTWHDVDDVELRAAAPLPLQVDGELLGDVSSVRLRSERGALHVVAPLPATV